MGAVRPEAAGRQAYFYRVRSSAPRRMSRMSRHTKQFKKVQFCAVSNITKTVRHGRHPMHQYMFWVRTYGLLGVLG